MGKSRGLATAMLAMGLIGSPASASPRPAHDAATMQVVGRHIYTARGERVILRGFNEMFGFSKNPRGTGIMEQIARTGANSVRIVTTVKSIPADWDIAVGNAIANGMVPIVECHSATGKWENLHLCVDYWLRPDVVALLKKHQRWLMLNIANEAGDIVSKEDFVAGYSDAVRRIRAAGIRAPLIIDGTKWGQEHEMLLDSWAALNKTDPHHQVIVSAHSYWIGTEDERKAHFQSIIDTVTRQNIPFILGEGPTAAGYDCTASPYGWAMTALDKAQIGWLTWSWGMMPNGDCKQNAAFDVTRDGIFGHWKSEAGRQIAIANPASIAATSRRPCSIPNAGAKCVRAEPRPNRKD